MNELVENEGKKRVTEKDGQKFERLPIKTRVITEKDDICEAAKEYAGEHLKEGDILFISE